MQMESVLLKRGRDTRMCAQRKGRVRPQREGGHLQTWERGLKRNQTSQHRHLGCSLQISEKTNFCCLSCPACVLCFGRLSGLAHAPWAHCGRSVSSSTEVLGLQPDLLCPCPAPLCSLGGCPCSGPPAPGGTSQTTLRSLWQRAGLED